MPPRYAYWTIIAGGLPTAFRAAEREELLPTFQRIKERHPDAEMKYFARGKLWDSREAVRATDKGAGRSRDWRPGGNHRDPRQKFIDAKKQRNTALRKERWKRRTETAPQPDEAAAPPPAGPRRRDATKPRRPVPPRGRSKGPRR